VVAGQAGLKDGTLVSLPGDDSAGDEDKDNLTAADGQTQVARAAGSSS